MSQVHENQKINFNPIEMVKLFFKALAENEYVEDPEEVVKKSGNEELIKSSNENIKNLEAMFKDTELSSNKMRDKLKDIKRVEVVKTPKIKEATIKNNETKSQEKKVEDNGLEL